MDYKIENGDWVSRNKKIDVVSGITEMMGYVEARLSAKKGRFYPNKDFGSFLFTLKNSNEETGNLQALQFARQALEDLPGVFVEKVTLAGSEAKVKIIYDNKANEVIIKL